MGAEGEALPELITGFEEENPDVTVEVTPVPWDSAHDKFTSAIAAGTAPLEDVEAWYLQKVLDAQGGSQSAAARVLGIDRGTVRRRLEKLD